MISWLQNRFALSRQGAKDLVKAIAACTATDIGLMFPVGLLFFLLRDLLLPLRGGKAGAPGFWLYTGGCLLLLALLFLLFYRQYNRTFLASYTESANQRITLAEKLRGLPLSFFGRRDLSDLTTTILSDCAGLETAFSHFIPELIGAVLSVVLVGIGLFFMDWRMALALLWVAPVAFAVTAGSRVIQDRAGRRSKQSRLDQADGIQECIEAVRDLKSNNQTGRYLAELDEKLRISEKRSMVTELSTGVFVVSAQMVLRLGVATVVLAGAGLLAGGETDLLTFLVFLIAASRIFDPLSSSLINLAAVFSTLLQVERMKRIEEQEPQGGRREMRCEGFDIRFDHVGFSYGAGLEDVLKDVSFTAKQGEITALVGPSGGGKSTAARLAARFWDASSGRITLGGVDIGGVDPETLLTNFAIVFQDVVLFNNTVLENIRIGRRGVTDREVLAAAKAAQCDEFVGRLPKGYETVIGENGSLLSGGERQRISIARALLKDAPIILLDEATASLDVENETKIQTAISNLVKDKTVLMIAHRMRTVAGADRIVVLEDGTVAEQGSPAELMERGGVYRRMSELQRRASGWEL